MILSQFLSLRTLRILCELCGSKNNRNVRSERNEIKNTKIQNTNLKFQITNLKKTNNYYRFFYSCPFVKFVVLIISVLFRPFRAPILGVPYSQGSAPGYPCVSASHS